jgi:hypothetical protein
MNGERQKRKPFVISAAAGICVSLLAGLTRAWKT